MTEAAYTGWALLELMGHRQRIGWVLEVEMYGGKLLRIDIAVIEKEATLSGRGAIVRGPSEFYGTSSIYSLRPLADDILRDIVLANGDPRPVQPMRYRLDKPEGGQRDMLDALGEKRSAEEPDEGDF